MIKVVMDVSDRPVSELVYMHELHGSIFPCDNGKCQKWYVEGGKKNEQKR